MLENSENMEEDSPDIIHVTQIINRLSIQELYDYLKVNEAFPQMAWVTAAVDNLEREIHILYGLAYADARGELTVLKLSLPEVTEDPDE